VKRGRKPATFAHGFAKGERKGGKREWEDVSRNPAGKKNGLRERTRNSKTIHRRVKHGLKGPLVGRVHGGKKEGERVKGMLKKTKLPRELLKKMQSELRSTINAACCNTERPRGAERKKNAQKAFPGRKAAQACSALRGTYPTRKPSERSGEEAGGKGGGAER